ncbi:hypothetical protein UFOVP48_20 [uncultured Caudovirales phage]|uniref:Uncharacterized protein n=1 Tax=uncultured Caudovirales phage TaxID=2100421 RepID=A0A6J5KTR5_9CAUD|nr:hypothetical protein UFOVP48_20 [uncultured Caudovirales phage]
MNVYELQTSDPKRFEKEYHEWCQHFPDYDWWEDTEGNFTDRCAQQGVRVDNITFSGFWSQGDGAAFAGRVYVYEWMEQKGYDLTHPAAYLASKDDGSYVRLEIGRGNNMRANYDGWVYTEPSGVFIGLEFQAWESLVEEQLDDISIEAEVLSFCEDLAQELYTDLRDEYEHLTSEAMFIEHCVCNEITFEENEDAIPA